MPSGMKKIKVSEPKHSLMGDVPKYEMPLYAPSFSVDAKQMPEVKNWDVDEEYDMMVRVRMTRLESTKRKGDTDDRTNAGFEIVAYKAMGKRKSIDEMDDKEFGEYQGQELERASKGS